MLLVSTFIDAMLVRLTQPDGLLRLLLPESDPGKQRIRALFAEVYHLPFAAVRDVLDVRVITSASQQPVFGARRANGSWLQTLPTTSRGDFQLGGHDREPRWIDLSAEVQVSLALEIDSGEVESFRLTEIGEFTTLEEFRQKFRFFDLDARRAGRRRNGRAPRTGRSPACRRSR